MGQNFERTLEIRERLNKKDETLGAILEISATTRQFVVPESSIVEHSQIEIDKLAAKAKPRSTSNLLASFSTEKIPIRWRGWIDFEYQQHMQKDVQSYFDSKRMNVFRHGTILRDEDGAIQFWRWKTEFKPVFLNFVNWSI